MSHRSIPSPTGPYTGLIRKSYRSVGESRDMRILYEMNANPSILFTIDMKFHFGHHYLISLLWVELGRNIIEPYHTITVARGLKFSISLTFRV